MPAAGEKAFEPGLAFIHNPDALLLTDFAGRLLALNPQAVRLTGWRPAEAVGRPWCLLVGCPLGGDLPGRPAGGSVPSGWAGPASRPDDDAPACRTQGCPLLARTAATATGVEVPCRRPGGETWTAEVDASLLPTAGGRHLVLIVLRDVTARCEERRLLEERASTDALTGLGNRFRLSTYSPTVERGTALVPATVAVLDVDNMKTINDSCGHEVGDRVLRAIGELLRRNTRHSDLAVRYGGDEFVLLLPHTTLDQAKRLMRRLEALTASLQAFLELPLPVGLSYGLARVSPGQPLQKALVRADRQMYRRKLLRERGDRDGGRAAVSPRTGARGVRPRPGSGRTTLPVQLHL